MSYIAMMHFWEASALCLLIWQCSQAAAEEQSVECYTDNWISAFCSANLTGSNCGELSLILNNQRMNFVEIVEGVAKFTRDFDSFGSLKCRPKVKAKLITQKCGNSIHVIDNFRSVRPGRPTIESVNAGASSANIRYARSEKVTCFGRLTKLPLFTQILVHDVHNQSILEETTMSLDGMEIMELHPLIPYRNYTVELRQRPLLEAHHLWSDFVSATFSTSMAAPARPQVHPLAFEVNCDDFSITLHWKRHTREQEQGTNFAYHVIYFNEQPPSNMSHGQLSDQKWAERRTTMEASYKWTSLGPNKKKSHYFVIFASNDAGISPGSESFKVDFQTDNAESCKQELSSSVKVARSAALGYSSDPSAYSIFWEWINCSSASPRSVTLFFCSAKTSQRCLDGLFWLEAEAVRVKGDVASVNVSILQPFNTIGIATEFLSADPLSRGILWFPCQLVNDELLTFRPKVHAEAVEHVIFIHFLFQACEQSPSEMGLLVRRATIQYCFIEDPGVCQELNMEGPIPTAPIALSDLQPGASYEVRISFETLTGLSEVITTTVTLAPSLVATAVEAVEDAHALRLWFASSVDVSEVVEVDYQGSKYRLKLNQTSHYLNFNKDEIHKDPTGNCRTEGDFLRFRLCNIGGCSEWSGQIAIDKRPSSESLHVTIQESPPDIVQITWDVLLPPAKSDYYFDIKITNATSQEVTLFENITSRVENRSFDMNCHKRQFNETMYLPLCSSTVDWEENVYEILIRRVVVTAKRNALLIGPWTGPVNTSYKCGPTIKTSILKIALISLGIVIGLLLLTVTLYWLFLWIYSVQHLFGQIESPDDGSNYLKGANATGDVDVLGPLLLGEKARLS